MATGFFGNVFGRKEMDTAHIAAGLSESLAEHKETGGNPIFEYALDAMPCNAMYCDRDSILRFLNKSSKKTLGKLQQYLPHPVEALVGKSIHVFHQNPTNVDRILGNDGSHLHGHGHAGGHPDGIPKTHGNSHSLPHKAVIHLGPEKLDLEIEPMYDRKGQYVGAVVMWGLTTQKFEAMETARNLLEGAIREIDTQLTMVATATHEIDASIGEIAKNASEASKAASNTRDAGNEGIKAISNLQESSTGVKRVADLIASIATQTSVLALNATIEAARAGVHGKGFSVVASEVKKLAEATAKATAEIQKKVAEIADDLEFASKAMDRILQETDGVNSLSHMLAASAEEQRLATKEMAHSLEVANERTSELARNKI